MATAALLKSALVQRALVEFADANSLPGEVAAVRQTTNARAYHEQLGKLDQADVYRQYLEELRKGPGYKRIRRGSIYGILESRKPTLREARSWFRLVDGTPRRPHGVKASAGAPPSITQATIRVADKLSWIAIAHGTIVVSAAKLARKTPFTARTVERAIAALVAHGYLTRQNRRKKHPGRFQIEERQAANCYVLRLPTDPHWLEVSSWGSQRLKMSHL